MIKRHLQVPIGFAIVLSLLVGCAAPAREAPTAATSAPSLPIPSPMPTLPPSVTPPPDKAAAPAPPTLTPTLEKPRYGGVLVLHDYITPPGLDPHTQTNHAAAWAVAPVYNALVKRDDQADPTRIVTDLAEKWEISPDGLVYTFSIPKGVKFHDGTPLTIEDVKFSMERQRFPAEGKLSPRQKYLQAISKIETPDSNTLRLILSRPSASLLNSLSCGWVMIVSKQVAQTHGDLEKTVVGTGPFKWVRYERGILLNLTKNPDYFKPGLPYLDGLKLYYIPDVFAYVSAFRTQRIDIISPPSRPRAPQAELIKREMPGVILQSCIKPGYHGVMINLKRKPWDDIRVREAASLAFDRQAAVKIIEDGFGFLIGPMHPLGPWGIPQEELLKLPGYRQPKDADITRARRLMAEAGYPTGFSTEAIGKNTPEILNVGAFVKEELKKLGIDMKFHIMDAATELKLRMEGAFDINAFALALSDDDPDIAFGEVFTKGGAQNYGGYTNPKLERLYIEQSQSTDPKKRKEIVLEMSRIVLEDYPYVFLSQGEFFQFLQRYVKGVGPVIGGIVGHQYEQAWLSEAKR